MHDKTHVDHDNITAVQAAYQLQVRWIACVKDQTAGQAAYKYDDFAATLSCSLTAVEAA